MDMGKYLPGRKLGGAVCGLLATAAAAFAGTPVNWVNTTSTAADDLEWGIAANWTDSGGEPLTVAPTNAADSFEVTLPALGALRDALVSMTISTGKSKSSGSTHINEYPAVDPSIYSITGTPRHVIGHTVAVDDASRWNDYSGRAFTVCCPNAFDGFWQAGEPLAMFAVPEEAQGFTPTFQNVLTDHRVRMRVPNGAVARVENVGNGGVLAKADYGGTLEIGRTTGAENSLIVEGNGTVKFGGVASDDSDIQSLLAKAAVRFDASVASSIITNMQDGLCNVVEWKDADGRQISATLPTSLPSRSDAVHVVNYPFLSSSAVSPTGLPLVDFGSRDASQVAEHGPTNCVLVFNSAVSGVRELFYAGYKVGGYSTLLAGSSSSYDYHANGSRLFTSTYTSVGVLHGDILFNGKRIAPEYSALDWTKLYVVSVGSISNTTVNLLASDRYTEGRTGGCCIGEVIAFTNELTRAERLVVDHYLNAKWRTGDRRDEMFGSTISQYNYMTYDVPAGRTAGIGEVSLQPNLTSFTITKTGEGTLRLGSVPDIARIDVNDGSVVFGREPVSDDRPADDTYYWFDASAEGALDYTLVDGTNRVDKWYDKKDGSVYCSPSSAATYKPYIVENAYGSLRAVSMGVASQNNTSDSSWMHLPHRTGSASGDDRAKNSRTGFAAIKFVGNGAAADIFESGNSPITLRSGTTLLNNSYRSSRAAAATWRIDGSPSLVWTSNPRLSQNEEFMIVSFSDPSDLGLPIQGFGGDRNSTGNSHGGIIYGEFILYKRQLSDRERRQTEAYLMKKWNGKTHPSMQSSSGRIRFAASVSPTFDSSSDLTVAEFTGGQGDVVKRGAGHVTITTPVAKSNFKTLEMHDGGKLTLTSNDASGFELSSIAGSGILETPAVTGVGTLEFSCAADACTWDSVTVLGDVALASPLTVKLSAAGTERLACGDYVLFSASDLSGFDAGSLVVDIGGIDAEACRGRVIDVRNVGNDIVLSVRQMGMTIIVR